MNCNPRERGAVLIVALLIIVIMSLLGLAFALVAETENKISVNEKHQAQALFVAEGTARVVKGWFDNPDPSSGFLVPSTSQVNRTLRWVDHDHDGTYQSFASASAPWNVVYREGTDDLFERPYKGTPAYSLVGTRQHPDLRISDTGTSQEQAYLTTMNDALFPSFPSPRQRVRVRQIDVFEAPIIEKGSEKFRYGIATVAVRVGIFDHTGTSSEAQIAERTVEAVFNEIPYRGPRGPLQSCKSIDTNGDFNVHWGDVTAVNDGILHSNIDEKIASAVPYYGKDQRWGLDNNADGVDDDFDADGIVDFYEWFNNADNTIEDPWQRFLFGGGFNGAPPPMDDGTPNNQPLEFGPLRTPPAGVVVDAEHSNIFLHVSEELCPDFPYELWKAIALAGGQNVHYYAYDSASGKFRENGTADPETVKRATNDNDGLFFFDTVDGLAPHDDDADGFYDNLTPEESINGSWRTGGFIYLNSEKFTTTGLGNPNPPRAMNAPGEPFIDGDLDGVCDSNEYFLDLTYPSSYVGSGYYFTKAHWTTPATAPGGVVYNDIGPARNERIHMFGVLYTNGQWNGRGQGVYYGAVVTKEGVSEDSSPSAGTPDIFFDEGLIKGKWPPSSLRIPRTFVSLWEVDIQ